jgi:multiple sugar transport system permease protein
MEREQMRVALPFVIPAVLLFGVFFVLPVAAGFLLSLTDFDIYALGSPETVRFVGLRNFDDMLRNPAFWQALRNTLFFVLVGGPLSVIASLAAALLLSAKLVRLRTLFRTIYFAPVVTSLVAVAIVWRYLYHPRYGLLNAMLGTVGIGPIDWLGDPKWAMPAIVLLAVWRSFGYNMLIFLAGLQSIPEDLYEAAEVDGAGFWWKFWHVTMPGLGPTFLFVSITTMIGYFQLFAEPYVMTQGGPLGATRSLMLFLYEEGFRWWRMGTSSTIAVLLFVLTLGGTLLQLRLQRKDAGRRT